MERERFDKIVAYLRRDKNVRGIKNLSRDARRYQLPDGFDNLEEPYLEGTLDSLRNYPQDVLRSIIWRMHTSFGIYSQRGKKDFCH